MKNGKIGLSALAIAAIIGSSVFFVALIAHLKFEKKLIEISVSRLFDIAHLSNDGIEFGLGLGLEIASFPDLRNLVLRIAQKPGIEAAAILDPADSVLFSSGPPDGSRLAPALRSSTPHSGEEDVDRHWLAGERLVVSAPIRNAFGQTVGRTVLVASLAAKQAEARSIRDSLTYWLVALAVCVALLTMAAMLHAVRPNGPAAGRTDRAWRQSLTLRLSATMVSLMIAVSALAAWGVFQRFHPFFEQELRYTVEAITEAIADDIDRAASFGMPLRKMPRLDADIETMIARHHEIVGAMAADGEGAVVAASGVFAAEAGPWPLAGNGPGPLAAHAGVIDVNRPLDDGGERVGQLHLGLDEAFLVKASADLALDVVSVLVVMVLIMVELILLTVHLLTRAPSADEGVATDAAGPSSQDLTGLKLIRLPIFLFCMAEELSRSFFPAFAISLAPTAPWLDAGLAVSLPITLFMMIWGVSQPLGAQWSLRVGRERTFVIGAVVGAAGLAMTAVTGSLLGLLMWRCVTAVGYGLVLIAAQGMVIDRTSSQNRAAGMAIFIGSLLAAAVCGPAAGGIIADQFGFQASFASGACLALVSALLLLWLFGGGRAGRAVATPRLSLSGIRLLLADRRFVTLMLLSAVPTKVAATGILFCLLPLLMTAQDLSKADIGRVQMVYFIVFLLTGPLFATLSDRFQARRGFITIGGLGTLLAAIPVFVEPTVWAIPLAVSLFGLCQSVISSPQMSLVSEIARTGGSSEAAAVGWYRLIERMGAAAGPMVVVAFGHVTSYQGTFLWIGILCFVSSLLFLLLFHPIPLAGRHKPC